jgi:hypothetical protein
MDCDDQLTKAAHSGYRYSLRFRVEADSCMTFWFIAEIARNSAISAEGDPLSGSLRFVDSIAYNIGD